MDRPATENRELGLSKGKWGKSAPVKPKYNIHEYRQLYEAMRREIEAGLRAGEVHGVVSTNALELGIDIGSLRAAVLVGYPGTIASTWQQLGRAGRRDGSIAVFVASASPLDCDSPLY